MKKKILSLGWAALVIFVASTWRIANAEENKGTAPSVAEYIDLKKYMGLWYEIATIPMWFQKKCVGGTTAEYSLKEDGTVKVVNSCFTAEGEPKIATGRAWVEDETTNAKLKVSFVPGKTKLFAGDYWILEIGPEYEYAVVGDPKRKYGWILSRTKEISEETLKGIVSRLEKQGHDFEKFVTTNQKDF